MAAKGYTNKGNIENYLLIDIDASFDDQVDMWIEDIERFIDTETGRNFIADSEASARLFDGTDSDTIVIDDCVEVDTVEIGSDQFGSSFSSTENYLTFPANAVLKLEPIKGIILKSDYFGEGTQNQRITAKWGYSVAVPGDIRMVATILVAHIYKFGRAGIQDGVASERIGNYTVSYQNKADADEMRNAMQILGRYKRYSL